MEGRGAGERHTARVVHRRTRLALPTTTTTTTTLPPPTHSLPCRVPHHAHPFHPHTTPTPGHETLLPRRHGARPLRRRRAAQGHCRVAPAADHGRADGVCGADGRAHRLQGAVPVGRRRGAALAGHARPRGHHALRRRRGRAPHHARRRWPPHAAARRRRHRLRRCAEHRAYHQGHGGDRRGGRPHRGPGGHQALRPPAEQAGGATHGDGRAPSGGLRCALGSRFLHHGAHRCRRRRGHGSGHPEGQAVRRGRRRRRHLRRGTHQSG